MELVGVVHGGQDVPGVEEAPRTVASNSVFGWVGLDSQAGPFPAANDVSSDAFPNGNRQDSRREITLG